MTTNAYRQRQRLFTHQTAPFITPPVPRNRIGASPNQTSVTSFIAFDRHFLFLPPTFYPWRLECLRLIAIEQFHSPANNLTTVLPPPTVPTQSRSHALTFLAIERPMSSPCQIVLPPELSMSLPRR